MSIVAPDFEKIISDMIKYYPCPRMDQAIKVDNLDSWGVSREASDFLLGNPNALLYAAIFDYQIPYAKAWEAPHELKRRMGDISPAKIASMTEEQLFEFIKPGEYGNALHRFTKTITKRLRLAAIKLISEYEGDAKNIWPNGSKAGLVINRLNAFNGISQKISRMMTRLLGTYFGIKLTDWNEIDVAVDRHVARVFLRSGLIGDESRDYKIDEIKMPIIGFARQMRPQFPGCLDEPAFTIGTKWCKSQAPSCNGGCEGIPCPISEGCLKRVGLNVK